MFGPFPWQVQGIRQLPVVLDVAVWWFLTPSLWLGARQAWRILRRRVVVLAVPSLAAACLLSLAVGNFGTLARERMQVVVLLIPMVALGLAVRSARRWRPLSRVHRGLSLPEPRRSCPRSAHPERRCPSPGRYDPGMAATRSGTELSNYLAVLQRRKWTIALAVAVVVGTTLALSLIQTPIYEGRARMLLQNNQSLFATAAPQRVDPSLVETEIEILHSEPVRALVRERVGSAPGVSATPVGNTAVVRVTAQSTQPAQAAAVTNAYVDAYIQYRRQQALDNLLKARQEIEQAIASTQRQIEDYDRRLAAVAPSCSGTNTTGCSEKDSLQRSRDTLVQSQVPFKQKLDQLQVDTALNNGGASLSPATVPTEPVRPRPVRNGVLALGVGLVLGISLAFLFDQLDDTLKSKEDLEQAAHDLAVVGMIPLAGAWRAKGDSRLVSKAEPSSPTAEAYRTLRTSIKFLRLDQSMRVLQITSPNANEGKTTTVANLALALARAGERVVVVSCDLRRPRIHDFFGLPISPGFTSVLLGDVPLSSALQQVPGESRLALLSSGALPPNPSELLSSGRADGIFSALRGIADVVLVDSPPVLPVTDAAVLAGGADAVLIVARAGVTTADQLGRTVELLRQVGAPVAGTVLNGVPAGSGSYAYSYAYGASATPPATDDPGNRPTTADGRRKQPASAKGNEEGTLTPPRRDDEPVRRPAG